MNNVTGKIRLLEDNIGRVIKGKSGVIRAATITLLARGHLLIEDVPGVGKTTLAHAIAQSLGCSFKRIQFTSDLLPSDIIGVSVYNQNLHEFQFKEGPIFSNIILADEINRTTPKTQSCLLEAMNDYQVSVENMTYPLPRPFLVIATQNPLEFHGTYPLPESQIDRFMMRTEIGYPAPEHELKILDQRGHAGIETLSPVLSKEELIDLQASVEMVRVEESLKDYLLRIVNATRISDLISLGVSTRGAQHLYRAAQARALTEGRGYCIPDDFKELALPVLVHRLILRSGFGPDRGNSSEIIREILEKVPVPI